MRIEEELAKQVALEMVELSSGEENSEKGEEVKILTEKSRADSVEESGSESSGEMKKLARSVFIFFIDFILDSSSDEENPVPTTSPAEMTYVREEIADHVEDKKENTEEAVEDVEDVDEKKETKPDLVSQLSELSGQLVEPDLSDDELISILVQLAVLEVTVPALLETGAGKVVRKLKGREGKVGRLAGQLVIRWKKVVLNYNPDEEQEENIDVQQEQVMTENKVDTSHELLNQTGLVQGCGAGGHDHKDYGEDQDYPDIPDEDQMFTFPEVDAELPSLEADYYDDFYNAENDRPENIPSETPQPPSTPEARNRTPVSGLREEGRAVTPQPDYSLMLTPQLRAELKKFGLKVKKKGDIGSVVFFIFIVQAVPRRKACLLLNHIYEETHPLVPSTPQPQSQREDLDSSQESEGPQDQCV